MTESYSAGNGESGLNVDNIPDEDIHINETEKTIDVGNPQDGMVVGIPMPEEMVKEEDKRPEWLPENFKTPESLVESYKLSQKKISEMGQKLGAFQGSPEEYILPQIEGWEWDKDDNMLNSVLAEFKADGMSQEHAEKYLKTWVTNNLNHSQDLAEERKALGHNADQRINNVVNWARNNLPESQAAIIEKSMEAPTAGLVELFETLKGQTIQNSIAPPNTSYTTSTTMTLEQLQDDYAANLYKGKKIAENEHLQKEYDEKFEKLLGQSA